MVTNHTTPQITIIATSANAIHMFFISLTSNLFSVFSMGPTFSISQNQQNVKYSFSLRREDQYLLVTANYLQEVNIA